MNSITAIIVILCSLVNIVVVTGLDANATHNKMVLEQVTEQSEQRRLEIVKLKYDLKQMGKYAESRQALCTVRKK